MFHYLGVKLRTARIANSLSQLQVATALNTTAAHISILEAKPHLRPNIDLLVKLSKIYRVSLEYLLDDEVETDCVNEEFLKWAATTLSDENLSLVKEITHLVLKTRPDTDSPQDPSATPGPSTDSLDTSFTFPPSLPK